LVLGLFKELAIRFTVFSFNYENRKTATKTLLISQQMVGLAGT